MEDDIKANREAAIARAAVAYGLNLENPDDRDRLLGILAQQRFPPLKIFERPIKGDQIDFSPRGEVVRRIERMKYEVTRGSKALDNFKEFDLVKMAELWTTSDREREAAENANKRIREVSEFFEYLDTYFIAPRAADDPELADDGYYCVDSLIFSAWGAGCLLNDVVAKKVKTRLNGKIGGKKSAVARKSKWHPEGLVCAKGYEERHPNYKISDLVRHLRREIKKDLPKSDRAIRAAVNGWIEEGKLTPPKKIARKQA
jgi:hypothetical protein